PSLASRRRPPRSPLFPYPTLFRSLFPIAKKPTQFRALATSWPICTTPSISASRRTDMVRKSPPISLRSRPPCESYGTTSCCKIRSEEHTSELQSRENLVCRLLLEK